MNLVEIGMLVVFVLSCIFIYKFWKMALYGKVPQSPAAMGLSVTAASFLIAVSLYVAWYIDLHINGVIGKSIPIYLYFSVPILISSLVLSGYLAAKTTEDTAKMNVKLLLALALVPHFLVSIIAFMYLPGWINYLDMLIYVPCILVGWFLYTNLN